MQNSQMKIALVLDWPSADAPADKFFSDFEWTVTKDLLQKSGLKPAAYFAAHNAFTKNIGTLYTTGKVGGPLTTSASASRAKLLTDLQNAGIEMVLTMGPHALYCLTELVGLDTYRGTHLDCPFLPGVQVVPTYSPVIYSRLAWHERPYVASCMRKVQTKYIDAPRTIYIPETISDLYDFSAQHITSELVFDVETNIGCRITDFSVAPTSSVCLYVQLEDRAHKSFWSPADEVQIFAWLHILAVNKNISWGFHNATYDLTYLDAYGIKPLGHIFDTMLRHHAYQPEWEKSLGFLASLHLPTRPWKHLRQKAKKEFLKAGSL